LFEFAVSNATDVDGQPGWYLELSSAQTKTLSEGMYIFDERIVLATGDVQYNDSTLVYVKGTIDDGPN
jgi:precorrin isomerase